MPNPNNPRGFAFVRDIVSGATPQFLNYEPVVAAATTVFRGQPVKFNAAGALIAMNGTFATDVGAGVATMVGIAQANRTTGQRCPVVLAKDAIFLTQMDGGAGSLAVGGTRALIEQTIGLGLFFAINNIGLGHAGGLGHSIADLDMDASSVDDQYCQIVGWHESPDNEFGAFGRVLVRFNPELFTQSPVHVTTVL